MNRDYLEIVGLKVKAKMGVTSQERTRKQPIELSLRIYLENGLQNRSDQINHTVDYAAVCQIVTDFVLQSRYHLMETLTEKLAHHLLDTYPLCDKVEIELKKFILKSVDYAAVHMTCDRSKNH